MNLGVVLALAAGTYGLRLAGPMLRGRVTFSPRWEQLMSIAAITLLGSFVVMCAVVEAGGFAGWARLAGVAVGAVLAWRRAPFVIVVLAAAGVTAGLRLCDLG